MNEADAGKADARTNRPWPAVGIDPDALTSCVAAGGRVGAGAPLSFSCEAVEYQPSPPDTDFERCLEERVTK